MGEKYDGTNGLAAYVGGCAAHGYPFNTEANRPMSSMYDFHDAATAIPEWLLNGGYDKEGKREWKSPFNLHLKTDQVFYERLSPWGASRFAQAMNGTRFWEEIGNMSTGERMTNVTCACAQVTVRHQDSRGPNCRKTRWSSTSAEAWARHLCISRVHSPTSGSSSQTARTLSQWRPRSASSSFLPYSSHSRVRTGLGPRVCRVH